MFFLHASLFESVQNKILTSPVHVTEKGIDCKSHVPGQIVYSRNEQVLLTLSTRYSAC